MAVKIRLARHGAKKAPFYRMVVADSRAPRDGKFIEILGTYNPMIESEQITIDNEKALSWIAKGAQPTESARAILVKSGALEPKKAIKTAKKVEAKKAETKEADDAEGSK